MAEVGRLVKKHPQDTQQILAVAGFGFGPEAVANYQYETVPDYVGDGSSHGNLAATPTVRRLRRSR